MVQAGRRKSVEEELARRARELTENQLRMIASVTRALEVPVEFIRESASDLVDGQFAEITANFLTLHHALHEEVFSKRPFEYLLKQCLIAQGHEAHVNPAAGDTTYDVEGGGYRWSLKTEAAKGISQRQVKVEKLMEARWVRECPTPDACAREVRLRLPQHMDRYDRILVLRAFARAHDTIYKLEEIPKEILVEAFSGVTGDMFEMRGKAKSFGADFHRNGNSFRAFRILLDSSVEKVRLWFGVDQCVHHGTWIVPRIEGAAFELYANNS